MNNLLPIERIENKIYLIRGQKVMLDKDLAELYGVKPIRLREQVKRNLARFPRDFMFQLTAKEAEAMVSQNAIPSKMHLGGHLPLAFTEHGILMLSSVLKSDRAIAVNIAIMRTFLRLRTILASHVELTRKVADLKRATVQNSADIQVIFQAIREMLTKPEPEPDAIPRKIGFQMPEEDQ